MPVIVMHPVWNSSVSMSMGVEIEGRQRLAVADRVVERGRIGAALDQRVDQGGRRDRIEPRAVELAVAEQSQDAERVVDLFLATPRHR